MHDNEAVTNTNYSTDVRTTEGWLADADPQNILEPLTDVDIYARSRILFLRVIFSLLMTLHVV